ncbi:MAG: adenine phosphoribosyltransferase [Nonlabens sp.]
MRIFRDMDANDLKNHVRDVVDFPKPGIVFKDISGLLAFAKARTATTSLLVQAFLNDEIDAVVGIEARGFLWGTLMAQELDTKFVMMRKPGKLPGATISQSYDLEYGTDQLELQEDAIKSGSRVLIHDDVLATGGTAAAAAKLVEKAGGAVLGFSFVMELEFLNGRDKFKGYKVSSVLSYD